MQKNIIHKLNESVGFYIFVKTYEYVQFMENLFTLYAISNESNKSSEIEKFLINYLTNGKKISKKINTRKVKLTSEKYSYRIINHWEQEGVLDDKRPSGKGWRKYSYIERFWIGIIGELRSFGYPLEDIRTIKNFLTRETKTDLVSDMPLLETYFVVAHYLKRPCYLIVFKGGKFLISSKYDDVLFNSIEEGKQSHIFIYLNQLLQRLFKEDFQAKETFIKQITAQEMEALVIIRTKNYEQVIITKKNGKIEMLEATESIETDKRITEILQKGDYQNIDIKQAGGKVVSIKRTTKKKL